MHRYQTVVFGAPDLEHPVIAACKLASEHVEAHRLSITKIMVTSLKDLKLLVKDVDLVIINRYSQILTIRLES